MQKSLVAMPITTCNGPSENSMNLAKREDSIPNDNIIAVKAFRDGSTSPRCDFALKPLDSNRIYCDPTRKGETANLEVCKWYTISE